MHAGLLVADWNIGKVRILLQRLADARDVAVAEYAEHSGKERVLRTVALHILILQIADQRLGHGESPRLHAAPPALAF